MQKTQDASAYDFGDEKKYRRVFNSKNYIVSSEGEVFRKDKNDVRKLDVSHKGTVFIHSVNGGHYEPEVRKLVAIHFMNKMLGGFELVSLDDDIKNAKLSNLSYAPILKGSVKKKDKRWVGRVIYLTEDIYLGTFVSKDAANKKVNNAVEMLERYNDWEDEIFHGCVKSFVSTPYI